MDIFLLFSFLTFIVLIIVNIVDFLSYKCEFINIVSLVFSALCLTIFFITINDSRIVRYSDKIYINLNTKTMRFENNDNIYMIDKIKYKDSLQREFVFNLPKEYKDPPKDSIFN